MTDQNNKDKVSKVPSVVSGRSVFQTTSLFGGKKPGNAPQAKFDPSRFKTQHKG